MTKVLLARLWVHDAANLANNVAVWVLDEAETIAAHVESRSYAGGRVRAISSPGRLRSIPLALRSIPRADYLKLCEIIGEGRLVLVRLPRGRKLWGKVAQISAAEHRRVDRLDTVALVVDEVTYSESIT